MDPYHIQNVSGVDQYIVDVSHYNQNHRSWMEVVENYKYLLKFDAIIITGWQRYDHFSILCELLPVGLPSLLMNLKILEGESEIRLGPSKEVAKILHCRQPYALLAPSFGSPQCSYPGGEVLENVHRLHRLIEDFEELKKNSRIRGWMSSYNIKNNFTSPDHINSIVPQLTHLGEEIEEIEDEMIKALLLVYDDSTKDEWISTYIYPLKTEIQALLRVKDVLLGRDIWQRRPFQQEEPEIP